MHQLRRQDRPRPRRPPLQTLPRPARRRLSAFLSPPHPVTPSPLMRKPPLLTTLALCLPAASCALAQGGPGFMLLPDGGSYFKAPSARSFNTQEAAIYGGKGSGDDLSLYSTAHATKGKVIFGAAGTTFFSEATNTWTFANPLPIASGGTA